MAQREWADKRINKQPMAQGSDSVNANAAIKLLQAEHARAIRIVNAEIKRVKMDQHVFTAQTKGYLLEMLNHLLTALQRGRGGKG